jgi:hypothetical protein
MKRPLDDEGGRNSSADSRAEKLLAGFLQKHPRFLVYFGVGLGVLILVGIIVAFLIGRGH